VAIPLAKLQITKSKWQMKSKCLNAKTTFLSFELLALSLAIAWSFFLGQA
jgi:hypothetical protein